MRCGRGTVFAILLGIAALAAMAWAGWSAMQRSAAMTLTDTSATAFAGAAPGASADLIVEALRVGAGGELTGRLLEPHGSGYRRTAVYVTARLTAGSAVLMGTAADIKPRAVLELSGRFDDDHRVRVARVVVLTGYVTVERR